MAKLHFPDLEVDDDTSHGPKSTLKTMQAQANMSLRPFNRDLELSRAEAPPSGIHWNMFQRQQHPLSFMEVEMCFPLHGGPAAGAVDDDEGEGDGEEELAPERVPGWSAL